MHRNTFLLVSLLAVVAALLVGVNIGRTQVPMKSSKTYRNTFCKVSFDYPDTFTLLESASGSAALTGPGKGDGILLTCQKDIPRPEGTGENIQDIRVGTVSAKLYNLQTLIFHHPGTKEDVLIAGTGSLLEELITSLVLLP